MNFTQAKQLEVWRTFSDGSRYKVGVLAQNRQGVFFQYQQDYLAQFTKPIRKYGTVRTQMVFRPVCYRLESKARHRCQFNPKRMTFIIKPNKK